LVHASQGTPTEMLEPLEDHRLIQQMVLQLIVEEAREWVAAGYSRIRSLLVLLWAVSQQVLIGSQILLLM